MPFAINVLANITITILQRIYLQKKKCKCGICRKITIIIIIVSPDYLLHSFWCDGRWSLTPLSSSSSSLSPPSSHRIIFYIISNATGKHCRWAEVSRHVGCLAPLKHHWREHWRTWNLLLLNMNTNLLLENIRTLKNLMRFLFWISFRKSYQDFFISQLIKITVELRPSPNHSSISQVKFR